MRFQLKGTTRKALAQKISEIIGEPAVYLKIPTCAYQIGPYLLSKTGELTCESMDDNLLEALQKAGFATDANTTEDHDEEWNLDISIPTDTLSD